MELSAEAIGRFVAEGHIYDFKQNCPIGIPAHMHVCIKHNDRYLIFSTCSSQVTKSIQLAQRRGYNINTYPVIAPDDSNHLTELTYINCNQVWEMSEKEFGELYKEAKISDTKGGGQMDEKAMALIVNGIKLSTEIPDDIKELF